jgi:transcriptional regulator with XRE-family HTH domain
MLRNRTKTVKNKHPYLIGITLLRLRTLKGMSQQQLAEEACLLMNRKRDDASASQQQLAEGASQCPGESAETISAMTAFIYRLETGEHKGGAHDSGRLIALARVLDVEDNTFVTLSQPLSATPSRDQFRILVDSLSEDSRNDLRDALTGRPPSESRPETGTTTQVLLETIDVLREKLTRDCDEVVARQIYVNLSRAYLRLSENYLRASKLSDASEARHESLQYRNLASKHPGVQKGSSARRDKA